MRPPISTATSCRGESGASLCVAQASPRQLRLNTRPQGGTTSSPRVPRMHSSVCSKAPVRILSARNAIGGVALLRPPECLRLPHEFDQIVIDAATPTLNGLLNLTGHFTPSQNRDGRKSLGRYAGQSGGHRGLVGNILAAHQHSHMTIPS